jgi:hypothetical protein
MLSSSSYVVMLLQWFCNGMHRKFFWGIQNLFLNSISSTCSCIWPNFSIKKKQNINYKNIKSNFQLIYIVMYRPVAKQWPQNKQWKKPAARQQILNKQQLNYNNEEQYFLSGLCQGFINGTSLEFS